LLVRELFSGHAIEASIDTARRVTYAEIAG
jgi:hypothetical protein